MFRGHMASSKNIGFKVHMFRLGGDVRGEGEGKVKEGGGKEMGSRSKTGGWLMVSFSVRFDNFDIIIIIIFCIETYHSNCE